MEKKKIDIRKKSKIERTDAAAIPSKTVSLEAKKKKSFKECGSGETSRSFFHADNQSIKRKKSGQKAGTEKKRRWNLEQKETVKDAFVKQTVNHQPDMSVVSAVFHVHAAPLNIQKKIQHREQYLNTVQSSKPEKKEKHLNRMEKTTLFLKEKKETESQEVYLEKDRMTPEEILQRERDEMFGRPEPKVYGKREPEPIYHVCRKPPVPVKTFGLGRVSEKMEVDTYEKHFDKVFGTRVTPKREEETPLDFRESIQKERQEKKEDKQDRKESKLHTREKEQFSRKQGIGKKAAMIRNAQYMLEAADKEITSTYDAEERKKSAAKDFLQKKVKERTAGGVKHQAKKVFRFVARGAKDMAAVFLRKAAVVIAPIVPYLAAGAVVICLFIGIIGAVAEYDRQQQEVGTNVGFFGRMYFWIEYETGRTDESAFATVLGDEGRAFGIQFDYRYALQPFMRYCYSKNPEGYRTFAPYLYVDKNTLRGNQRLADAWLFVFQTNKEEFINDQKEFAKINYYDGIEARAEQFGLRLKTRDETCKGAVLSYSFQCGSSAAYQAVQELTQIEDDEEFLNQIYALRTQRYPRFSGRYERELQTALALLNSFLTGTGQFICPVDMTKCTVTSEFGEYRSPSEPSHNGIDLASYRGVPVPTHSIADGVVEIAGYSPSAGNWVVIDHGNGIKAKYMHHSSIRVAVGQRVRKGEQIGNMGTTGQSTGVHLHLQIELNGVPVNPRNYITIPE